MNANAPPSTGSTSLSDILTAIKNLVTALNNETQTYLNVQGLLNSGPITAPTVVEGSAGRVCSASVTVAGTSSGLIYDGATTSAKTKPLAVINNTLGVQVINMPVSFGILVLPGTGMSVTVSYS